MRTPIVAGNWKMNKGGVKDATELANAIFYGLKWPGNVEVIIAPPFTSLGLLKEKLSNTYLTLASQNVHFKDEGAFTGEISALFLKDLGIDYAIIGHSERRQVFLETDEMVNKKIINAFKHGITPIFCIGETLEERESNRYFEVLKSQLTLGLESLSKQELAEIVIAYEPVWAIGTGKTANSAQIVEVMSFIRSWLLEVFSSEVSDNVRLLYGGSVNSKNANEILHLSNVDGALVGGASLKPQDFISIISSYK